MSPASRRSRPHISRHVLVALVAAAAVVVPATSVSAARFATTAKACAKGQTRVAGKCVKTVATTVAVTTPATPTTAAAPKTTKGTLTIGFDRDAARLDPNFNISGVNRTVNQAIFDGLLWVNSKNEIVPLLATSFDFPNNTTMHFVLRKGVKFSNGEAFNSKSVKFSFDRLTDPKQASPLLSSFKSIASTEIVGDYEVNLKLLSADAGLPRAIAEYMQITPADYYTKVGAAGFEKAPIGTGPYKFVSYVADDKTVVEANQDYWADSPKGKPQVDKVVFRSIPELTTRISELSTGGVDLISEIPFDQQAAVKSSGGKLLAVSTSRATWVQINANGGGKLAATATGEDARAYRALKDKRVRQALNYAVDRSAIISTLFGGNAIPMGQMFAPGGFGAPKKDLLYSYNISKAKQLLADAGYPNGGGLKFTMATAPTRGDTIIALVVDSLAQIGIDVKVETQDVGVFNQAWAGGQFPPLRLATWSGNSNLTSLLIKTGALISAYSNPDVDALIDKQAATLDPTARDAVMQDLTTILHDDPTAIYLWSESTVFGTGKKVVTSATNPLGIVPVTSFSVSG